jgi:hypothetical protein
MELGTVTRRVGNEKDHPCWASPLESVCFLNRARHVFRGIASAGGDNACSKARKCIDRRYEVENLKLFETITEVSKTFLCGSKKQHISHLRQ